MVNTGSVQSGSIRKKWVHKYDEAQVGWTWKVSLNLDVSHRPQGLRVTAELKYRGRWTGGSQHLQPPSLDEGNDESNERLYYTCKALYIDRYYYILFMFTYIYILHICIYLLAEIRLAVVEAKGI